MIMTKFKKIAITISVILIMLLTAYCAFCIFVEGTLPRFQTIYPTYGAFYRSVNEPTFMDSLPDSASQIQYYHHIYPFNEKNGYAAIIAEDEYEITKINCLQHKKNYINKMFNSTAHCKLYYMDDTSRLEPDIVDIFEKYNVDFFNKISHENMETKNYHFIWCYEDEFSPHPQIHCAIYNNETLEIIEISCTRRKLG